MTKAQLTTAKHHEELISFYKSILAALNTTGFWNVKLSMDGSICIAVGKDNYEITQFKDLTNDFIKKMKSRTEYRIRKHKKELSDI